MIWFKFYTIWGEGLQELSDAEAGRFIKSICKYADTGETEVQSGNEKLLYSMALRQLKQDAEHNAKISSVRAEAGRIGGLKKSEQLQTNDSNCKQKEAKIANASIKNNELRIKNKEIENVDLCAEAHVSAPEKPKLTPNDHDFWKFAKENAELAEEFYKASGLYPIGNQFGRWVNDLRNFREAGITIQQMQAAVQKIRREGRITISAPGSVFTTARNIALSGQRSKPYQNQQKQSWDEVAAKVQAEMTCSDAFVFDEVDSEVIDI